MMAVNTLAGEKKQSVPLVTMEKHVGEMDVDETAETLTDPDKRIIKQITIEDTAATNVLFEQLMGTGIVARKEYIKAHSQEAVGNGE